MYVKLNTWDVSNRGGRRWNGDLFRKREYDGGSGLQWHAHIATLSFPISLLYFHQELPGEKVGLATRIARKWALDD